jgi:hypothetical protein
MASSQQHPYPPSYTSVALGIAPLGIGRDAACYFSIEGMIRFLKAPVKAGKEDVRVLHMVPVTS